MKNLLLGLLVIILVGVGAYYVFMHPVSAPTGTPSATALYQCTDGKTITAEYYNGEQSSQPTTPGEPPTPTGHVNLTLSDGRTMTLPQTVSGSGVRFANADESFVFWNKGNGAFVLENNQQTYQGCISVVADPGSLPNVYENGTQGFSIRYPDGYTANAAYRYALSPEEAIGGVSFTIPSTMATGTNLSTDTNISVEEIPEQQTCSADLFFNDRVTPQTLTESGTEYSVASSTGAAAGNRYEETVYAIPGTNPCIGVRYFVHYGVFENYPAGAVQEFDKQALTNQFDAIRKTLTIEQ